MRVVDSNGNTKTLVGMSLPAGLILPNTSTVPYGWMLCDGSAISRTVYATLFAAIGTTYGIGDGSTTFNIPDLRQVNASTFGFRLTTLSGTAVTSADRTSQGTLYLTPTSNIGGTTAGTGLLSLYDGSQWNLYSSGEISLTLSISNTTNYDVFLYDNSGTLTLETVAWSSATARATAIDLQDGVLVKDGALTRRYVGTIRGTGSNVTEDSKANRFVANYYNRKLKPVEVTDGALRSTSSTTYAQVGSVLVNYISCVGDYFVRMEGIGIGFAPANRFPILGIGSAATTLVSGCQISLAYNITTSPETSMTTTLCEASMGLVSRYLIFRTSNAGVTTSVDGLGDGSGNPFTVLRAMVEV